MHQFGVFFRKLDALRQCVANVRVYALPMASAPTLEYTLDDAANSKRLTRVNWI